MSDQEPVSLGYAGRQQHLTGFLKVFVIIGVVLIFVWMIYPNRASSRGLAKRTACGMNLSSIAKSCLTYSEGNRGALPPNLEMLCIGEERAYLSPKQLVCPVSQLPYIYIPSQKNDADPKNVMAYEPLSYHKGQGGNIAFLDGSVMWRGPQQHQTLIAETKARIAAATQPMH